MLLRSDELSARIHGRCDLRYINLHHLLCFVQFWQTNLTHSFSFSSYVVVCACVCASNVLLTFVASVLHRRETSKSNVAT